MKLKTIFIGLAVLLIATGILLLKIAAELDTTIFYLAEIFLVVCLCFIGYFYFKVLKALDALANGMNLLNEQDFSSRLSHVGQHDADRIVDVFNRMMSELKAERLRLREQNYFLDLIIKSSPMGVIILDFDNKITSINSSAIQFIGINSEDCAIGKTIENLSTPLSDRLAQVRQGTTETLRIGDAMIYRCSKLSFVDRGFYHPFILIESLTSEVMKAEKKAYEKVIRMIAHEVNNSVAGVTSTLDMISDTLATIENCDDLQHAMQVCIERCLSMSNFITRFADVVKIPEPDLSINDLNECATHCATIMESVCNENNICIKFDLCTNKLPVMIDGTLIEHALVNIIKNAIESIGKDGNILIKTYYENSPIIEIIDTGKGIDNETANKLFTPFFSTKPNGQGLGLIFIKETLMKHNCRFSLRPYNDSLTRFIIHFPNLK